MRDTETTLSVEELNWRREEVASLRDKCVADYAYYKLLLSNGWPRELARIALPLNIYSRMFATVLHNLLHFISLRDHDHAQHEVRVYAQAMRELVSTFAPVTMAAYMELTETRPQG